ncbi:MAG: cysteine desulfurase family protein [Patescibacteria group bacterium]
MSKNEKIYLDCAATTPVDPEVVLAMEPYWSEIYANPGSLHICGQEAMKAIDESRETLQKFLGAKTPREIIFTGSATEANNLAIFGAVWGNSENPFRKHSLVQRIAHSVSPSDSAEGGNHARSAAKVLEKDISSLPKIITTAIEHPSVLEPIRQLAERGEVEVVYLGVDKDGLINLEELKNSIDENTFLVSIGYANNEIGTIQPIAEAVKIVKEFNKKIIFHTDAVQAIQFLESNVQKLGVDLMTISAHKIYGPKGIGALYVRDGVGLEPIIYGGGQEYGLRSGTENAPLIVGFAKAVDILASWKSDFKNIQKIKELRDYLWQKIKIRTSDVRINGAMRDKMGDKRLPNNLNIHIPHVDGEAMLVALSEAGICVSSGSACASRSQKPSHVISAIGGTHEGLNLRVTFGRQTVERDINLFLEILNKKIPRIG